MTLTQGDLHRMLRRCGTLGVLAALALSWAAAAQTSLEPTPILTWVHTLKATLPEAGSNAYVQPSPADAEAFRMAITQLLGGKIQEGRTKLNALNYDLFNLPDGAGQTYLVVKEKSAGFRGLGTYIINPRYQRNVALEVPHPFFDTGTPEEGAQLFTGLGARILLIAGTHRCADSAASSCTGKTKACSPGESQAFRVSDLGHSLPSFFQGAHEASDHAGMITISLHGNSSEAPDVEVSDGTNAPQHADALVIRFRNALAAQGVQVASCNWADDSPDGLALCGTTNVQGRFSNGSPDACAREATKGSGTFLHLEQHLNIRKGPAALIAAAASVLPVVR